MIWYPPILNYHQIHPQPRSNTPTLAPHVFEQQMAILAHRWQPIALSNLMAWLEGKMSLPRRGVMVTFDDGTEETFTRAFPILLKYRIPATIFLIAANVGKPGTLSPDQIRQMQAKGIAFGSHTYSHAYLPSLSIAHVHQELHKSKECLEKLGQPIEFLSYPAGGFTPEIINVVRELGYRAAFTTNRGLMHRPIDRWALRRITMHTRGASPLGIWVRCSGYYGLNRRLRRPA